MVASADHDYLMRGLNHNGLRFDLVVALRNRPLSQAGPRIFQRACDLASVPAGEAAMVGDTPETDVQGARQAGVILFVRTGTADVRES